MFVGAVRCLLFVVCCLFRFVCARCSTFVVYGSTFLVLVVGCWLLLVVGRCLVRVGCF